MNIIRRTFIATLAAAALLSGVAVAADANVAGEWDLDVQTEAGSGVPHFSLKQDGSTITGTYKGQLGEAPLTGTVKGNEVSWSFKVNAQGFDIECTYTGTVDGDTMTGKVSLGALGDGTFSGARKKRIADRGSRIADSG